MTLPTTVNKPGYHTTDDFRTRSQKLVSIRNIGVDPYPHKFNPSILAEALSKDFEDQPVGSSEDGQAGTTKHVTVAGRLVLFRSMGKLAFGQILDSSGKIQIMFDRDHTHVTGFDPTKIDAAENLPNAFKFIEKRLDLGDWVGIEGHLFRTRTGELTVYAKKVTLLCKSLLPLPEKYHGLSDKEVRYRKRWLDLIDHEDVRKTFLMRSRILHIIRDFFNAQHFIEVETPVLQSVYGGAAARPFTTHLNALDQDMFLRISLEIPLKKLIVGGMERIYEIGRVFRNEGLSKFHNPEFTELETYAAYWDYNDMMVFTEQLFETIALKLFNKTTVDIGSEETGGITTIDFKAPWKRLTMKEAIKENGRIDVDTLSDDEMRKILRETELDPKVIASATRGLLISMLFEEKAEKGLVQPTHITDHPIETTPLCKLHRNAKEKAERLVERFESFVCGKEICNAYSELNDPELQRELLEQQASRRDAGDVEACPMDEEFIEAICQGMPPTGGLGIGIDRLVMFFTNVASIRDILFFPLMKTEKAEGKKSD